MQRQLRSPQLRTTMVLALPKLGPEAGTDGATLTTRPGRVESSRGSRFRKLGWLVLLLAVIGTGTVLRLKTGSATGSPPAEHERRLRKVNVVKPQRTASTDVNLPGTMQA